MATQAKPGRPNDRQPDQWQKDLNPDPEAGKNIGPQGDRLGRYDLTAYDLKELHEQLKDFNSDELRQIPILQPGTRLKQGATYINLKDPARQEFKAMGDMEADENNFFVPKTEVGYQIWNRLIGVENPERMGEPSES
ncbi:hypothetical protein IQ238_06770 [Pleurocapsales cyanobacterium LEGE 06147]|nr:hypothetical protein [Pleurocapsales cyanobacterium LEGE 06147]